MGGIEPASLLPVGQDDFVDFFKHLCFSIIILIFAFHIPIMKKITAGFSEFQKCCIIALFSIMFCEIIISASN